MSAVSSDDNNSDNENKKKKKPDLATQVTSMGLNELQTQFRLAIAREDMDAAILYRDELADRVERTRWRDEERTFFQTVGDRLDAHASIRVRCGGQRNGLSAFH